MPGSASVDPAVIAGHHIRRRQRRHAADLVAVVDDDQPLLDKDARTRLQLCHPRAVFVHDIRPAALAVWHHSGNRSLDVVYLGKPADAVIVADDDSDNRLDRAARRRGRVPEI